jgi:hypothetical protein
VIFDYFTLSQGRPGWDRILERYEVETIVWKRDTPLGALLDGSRRWRRVYRDPVNAVWVRIGG